MLCVRFISLVPSFSLSLFLTYRSSWHLTSIHPTPLLSVTISARGTAFTAQCTVERRGRDLPCQDTTAYLDLQSQTQTQPVTATKSQSKIQTMK